MVDDPKDGALRALALAGLGVGLAFARVPPRSTVLIGGQEIAGESRRVHRAQVILDPLANSLGRDLVDRKFPEAREDMGDHLVAPHPLRGQCLVEHDLLEVGRCPVEKGGHLRRLGWSLAAALTAGDGETEGLDHLALKAGPVALICRQIKGL